MWIWRHFKIIRRFVWDFFVFFFLNNSSLLQKTSGKVSSCTEQLLKIIFFCRKSLEAIYFVKKEIFYREPIYIKVFYSIEDLWRDLLINRIHPDKRRPSRSSVEHDIAGEKKKPVPKFSSIQDKGVSLLERTTVGSFSSMIYFRIGLFYQRTPGSADILSVKDNIPPVVLYRR